MSIGPITQRCSNCLDFRLCYTTLPCATFYTALRCATLHYIRLCCATLHYTMLPYSVLCVPSSSPSRGGDVTVYVFDINQMSLITPFFILFSRLFLSLWPFQLYFIPQILLTTLRFLTLFFRSAFCLIGPFSYKSLCESLLQP